MREIFCRLGLHFWVYPKRSADGTRWVQGTHRYCETCELEQTHIMFGGWDREFCGIKKETKK